MFSTRLLSRFARASFGCMLAAALLLLPGMAMGQSMNYSGVESTLYGPSSYSHTPSPIAVDGAGDVFFVLEEGGGGETTYRLEELASGSTTPTVLSNSIGFSPSAMAVNQAGTQLSAIYSGNNHSCGGHNTTLYIAQATLGGGSVSFSALPCSFTMDTSGYYSSPSGVAVDGSGNLYIADSGEHRLYEISSGNTTPTAVLNLSGGEPVNLTAAANGTIDLMIDSGSTNSVGYVTTSQFGTSLSGAAVAPTSLIAGLSSSTTSLTADALGNVYVGNSIAGPVRRIINGSALNVDPRFGSGITGLATDASGNIYVIGRSSSELLLIGEESQAGAGNFGSVAVGSNASYTYTFTSSNATVGSINVFTQGAAGLDYQSTGGTCAVQHYNSGTTCTIAVQFSPKQPGLRSAAIVLTDGSGNLLGTGYVEGVGTGPSVAFAPGTQITAVSSVSDPQAIAVDGADNLYILQASGAIEKVPAGNGTPSTLATVVGGNALAVDGAGNLYITTGANGVVEVAPNGTQTTVASTGIVYADGVAVDGAGTLYILDTTAQSILRMPQGQTAINWVTGLTQPTNITTDSAGNIYVLATENDAQGILKITPNGTQTSVLSGIGGVPISGFSMDPAGNFYLSSPTQKYAAQVPAGCDADDCYLPVGHGSSGLAGLALDSAGNLYLAETGAAANVYDVDRVDAPSLSFAETVIGNTSSDSPQSILVQNLGNNILNAISPGLSIGAGFQQVAGSGTPLDCTAELSLAAGTSCNLSISFEPVVAGDISTSAVLTDNALNGNPATQTISLSGVADKVPTTLFLQTSNSNSNLDAQVTFTATVQSGIEQIATGSVEFLDGETVLGTEPVNDQGTATFSTSALVAGTHTINAVYSGDGTFLGSSNSLSQQVTAPAYSITATPSSLSLAQGQVGTVTLTMTPVGGFTGKVQITCTGLPQWAGCVANPPVLIADGSNTVQTSTLTITTLGPNHGTVNVSSNRGNGMNDGSRVMTASIFFLPSLLLGGFLGWERKKLNGQMKAVLMVLILVAAMSGMVGCGFSGKSAAPGAYTVTVTGASSSTSQLYTGPSNETVNFTVTITK